jgi:hypothetical protein
MTVRLKNDGVKVANQVVRIKDLPQSMLKTGSASPRGGLVRLSIFPYLDSL